MKRTPNPWFLVAVAVVISTLFLVRGRAQTSPSPESPVIIERLALRNQTAGTTTTLFTPTVTRLYRVSAYAEVTIPDPNANCVGGEVSWTDDAGAQAGNLWTTNNGNLCVSSTAQGSAQGEVVLLGKAGEPVTVEIYSYPDGFQGQYTAVITVEEL
jgi:hypothetical protein